MKHFPRMLETTQRYPDFRPIKLVKEPDLVQEAA